MRTSFVKPSCLITLVLALSFSGADFAQAVIMFDWATVGDVGNAPDARVMNKGPCTTPGAIGCEGDMSSGYGSVGYEYQITKHHVTMSQYAEFLNAVDPEGVNPLGLYNDRMEEFIPNQSPFLPLPSETGGIDFDESPTAIPGSKYITKSGQENFPTTWISWASAARFANWLSNGQGSGDTEAGVYNMIPTTTNDPIPTREAGATIFLTSEDEFYKAAYYNPTLNGGTGGYTEYGVGDTAPVVEGPAGGSTSANYANGTGGPSGNTYWQTSGGSFDKQLIYLTDVAAYETATSYYGLFDVDGNAAQWTETSKVNPFNAGQELPIARGGSWLHGIDGTGASYRPAQFFAAGSSSVSGNSLGIRIAQLVPASTLTADFDADGDVDEFDLGIWQSSFGAGVGGDTDGDDDTDGADFLAWQRQFTGNLTPELSALSSVPEPSSSLLAGCAIFSMAFLASSKITR